jgi:photosystem II stability/assembly factor-like uncharacterized protein
MSVRSKKRLLTFVLCVSLVSSATPVSRSAEQWRRLPGPNPEGASIEALFSHGDYLFAAGHNSVFRSTDQGQSWKSVNLGEIDRPPRITSFTAVGGTIFAGSSDEPMFRSTDNGLTWTRMEVPEDITTFLQSEIPIAMTSLAAIGGSLFAGTKCSSHAPIPCGIYRSTDNGKNWTRVGKGVADASISSLTVIGAELFAGGDSGAAGFRSPDLGNKWTKINVSIATPYGPVNDIAYNAFAVIGKQLFVGTNYGVFVSTDQGMNWGPINNGLPGFSFSREDRKYVKSFAQDSKRYIKALTAPGDTLFAVDREFGVFRFDNQSQSWTEVNNGLLNRNVNTLAVSGGKLFVGTDAGVWVSTDKGESWRSANSGMNAQYGVGEMAVRDNRLLVQAFGGVYASADNGNTWTPVKDSLEPAAFQIPPEWGRGALNKEVNCLAAINDVVIAGTGGGVFRSIDRGQNWEGASQGLPNGELGSLAPSINTLAVIGAKIYAGVENCGLFISDDLGQSWAESSRDLRELTVIGLISKGKKLFAATSEDGVFVSLDQGRHWKATGEFFSGKEILSLAGIGDHLLVGTTNGIYLSTDEGHNWIASETGVTDLHAHPFVVRGAKIFVATNNGLLVSSDQGRSWTKLGVIETGAGYIGYGLDITALAVSGNSLFAGTSDGVFLSTDGGRSWAQLGVNLRDQRRVLSLAVNGTDILAGCDNGRIYLSPDLGRRWAMVNAWIDPPRTIAPGIFTNETKVLNVSVAGKTHLIVGRDDGLFVSTTRGQTWRPTGVTRQVSSLSVIGSAIFAGGAGGVLISKDNGRSWAPSAVGLNNPYPVDAFAVKGDRIYVAQQGVYVSIDGGRSWTPINDGLPDLRMVGLVVNDTHIFVRTYHGWLFTRRL